MATVATAARVAIGVTATKANEALAFASGVVAQASLRALGVLHGACEGVDVVYIGAVSVEGHSDCQHKHIAHSTVHVRLVHSGRFHSQYKQ